MMPEHLPSFWVLPDFVVSLPRPFSFEVLCIRNDDVDLISFSAVSYRSAVHISKHLPGVSHVLSLHMAES